MFRPQIDNVTQAISLALTLVCVAIILIILVVLFRESSSIFHTNLIWTVITDYQWYPSEGKFGMLAMSMASALIMAGAVLLAVPLGLACAVFICFIAPERFMKPYRFMIALLAGMPSVVLGLWGLTMLVPIMSHWQPPGTSLMTASIVLSLMILPTVTLTAVAAFEGLPATLRHSATALGLRRHTQILKVLLPAAKAPIASGIVLSMARALGETMVVLMVAGNVVNLPENLFEPVRTLTANIALEMAYATDQHRAALYVSGLMLTLLVLCMAYASGKMQQEHDHG